MTIEDLINRLSEYDIKLEVKVLDVEHDAPFDIEEVVYISMKDTFLNNKKSYVEIRYIQGE